MKPNTALLSAVCLAGAVIAGGRDLPERFRSSPLGIDFEPPAGWVRSSIYGMCGNGLIDKTPEQLRRMGLLRASYDNEALGATLHLTVWEKWDGDESGRRQWLAGRRPIELRRYVCPNGTIGECVIVRARGDVRRESVTFVAYSPPRRVEMTFWLAGRRADALLPELEAVVRRLSFFRPVCDYPQIGTFKRVRGEGFTLHYPGDWTWDRPMDDAEAREPTRVNIEGPATWSVWRRWPATVTLSVELTDEVTPLDEAEKLMRRSAKENLPQLRLKQRRVRTQQGRELLRIELRGSRFSSIHYIYDPSVVDGKASQVVLQCVCATDVLDDFVVRFDDIAQRVEVE